MERCATCSRESPRMHQHGRRLWSVLRRSISNNAIHITALDDLHQSYKKTTSLLNNFENENILHGHFTPVLLWATRFNAYKQSLYKQNCKLVLERETHQDFNSSLWNLCLNSESLEERCLLGSKRGALCGNSDIKRCHCSSLGRAATLFSWMMRRTSGKSPLVKTRPTFPLMNGNNLGQTCTALKYNSKTSSFIEKI